MIKIVNASRAYQLRNRSEVFFAVKDLNLEINEGETLCLIGPSGCGKTTTLKLINKLIEPTSGKVFIDGQDIHTQPYFELRRKIGYVTQNGGLFPHLTVAKNIGLLCEYEAWSPSKIQKRTEYLLNLVGLDLKSFGAKYPCELSGGQRQRVCVARALALDPPYILMDEPFSALDPVTRAQIQDEFLTLESFINKTIVIVTHDMKEAFKLGDRVALMNKGALLQLGEEEDFRNTPKNEFVENFVRSQMEYA